MNSKKPSAETRRDEQALSQAGNQINDSVIQPGMSRAQDPALQAQVSSYWSQGGGYLSNAMRAGGNFAKSRFDVNVGDMGANYVERFTKAGFVGWIVP